MKMADAKLKAIARLGLFAPVCLVFASVATSVSAPPKVMQAARDRPYPILRKRLLLDGWLPVQNARCVEESGRAQACNRWLELQRCESDGRCLMQWGDQDGARVMRVEVSGMPAGDDADPEPARVTVTDIAERPVQSALPAAAHCPSTDFGRFLRAFASAPAVRQAFVVPLVRATVLVSDADRDRLEPAYIRGDRADVFNVSYRAGTFHHVGVDGVDADSLPLDIRAPSPDVREVAYVYGSSEGRSFEFTRRKDCWYLTGNPRPTGP